MVIIMQKVIFNIILNKQTQNNDWFDMIIEYWWLDPYLRIPVYSLFIDYYHNKNNWLL